jgi:flavodoxin
MQLIVVFAVFAAAVILLMLWLNREGASEVEVRNPEGDAGTALIVYHGGKGGFTERVTAAFAEGLVSNGWRVETTTASARAPTDLSGYDLLVVGGATYGFTPNRPIRDYVRRLGDLGGKPTATIITGWGEGERSSAIMQEDVRRANGELVKSLLLYSIRPNEDLHGINDAEEIATRAAKEIRLPGQ